MRLDRLRTHDLLARLVQVFAFTVISHADEPRILERAAQSNSPYLYVYLAVAFSTGMRAGEIRKLRWNRFLLGGSHEESYVRVGESKTAAGEDPCDPHG